MASVLVVQARAWLIRLMLSIGLVVALLGAWLGVWTTAAAQQLVSVPVLRERVTDLTGTLTSADKQTLSAKLAALEQTKGSQLAILLVPTTQPETIEQFGIRVAETWKLGRSVAPSGTAGASKAGGKVNDGVLLLVAKNDRKVRIEVGYGLEGAITDAFAKRIITENITPRFKQADFAGGLDAGVDQLVRLINGEALPAPWTPTSNGSSGAGDSGEDLFALLPFLLFGLMFAVMVLPRLFGRSLGSIIGGVGAGFVGHVLSSSLVLGAIAGIGVLFLILLFGSSGGQRVSRQMRRGGNAYPVIWGGGGGGGFGGGGGSSDSGFGGGGGDFGGGGASGDW